MSLAKLEREIAAKVDLLESMKRRTEPCAHGTRWPHECRDCIVAMEENEALCDSLLRWPRMPLTATTRWIPPGQADASDTPTFLTGEGMLTLMAAFERLQVELHVVWRPMRGQWQAADWHRQSIFGEGDTPPAAVRAMALAYLRG